MFARRLLRGGVTAPPRPPFVVTGPYDPGFAPSVTVLTQLHCHTTQSDGSFSPTDVVADYLGKGYGALQITDHDKVTTQPGAITTKISGNELSPGEQHIVSINSTYLRGGATDAQTLINGVIAAGGQAEIAHALWSTGMTYSEMAALTDYLGMEIHTGVVVPGVGSTSPVNFPGFAIGRWDELLTNVRRNIWGLAVDDLHYIDTYSTFDLGRVQVFASVNSVSGIMTSLVNGNFVADVSNQGLTPGYPVRSNVDISLTCTGAVGIEAFGPSGLLASAIGNTLTYEYEGTESYVRLEAIGDYTEPFSAALSDRWATLDGTWTVSGGTLQGTNDATARRLILRRHRAGDFEAQIDLKIGAVGSDLSSFMFNVLNTNYYYILRVGPSSIPAYNNKLAVGLTTDGNFTAAPFASTAFTVTAGTWYTLKMAYTAVSGTVQAKIWVRGASEPDWLITGSDTTWRFGGFGVRANRTPEFDNLYIKGFRTYYQPIAIDS